MRTKEQIEKEMRSVNKYQIEEWFESLSEKEKEIARDIIMEYIDFAIDVWDGVKDQLFVFNVALHNLSKAFNEFKNATGWCDG